VREDEMAAFMMALAIAAGTAAVPGALEPTDAGYEPDRTLAVLDGDRIVGGTASEPVELTVPGDVVLPTAKITLTGLLPGYRRQGLGGALFERQLPDLYARGEHLSVLMTARSGVPGRYGFSPATRAMAVTVDPRAGQGLRAPESGRRVRLVDRAEAGPLLPALYDRHRVGQPGQVSRPIRFWRSWFADDPALRIGPSARFFVLTHDADGQLDGYLTYRLDYSQLREQPVRELIVEDLITVTDAARRALWAFCLQFDPAVGVSAWNVPVDEPLRWMVSSAGAVRVTAVREFLRLRLVNVARALAARQYAQPDTLTMRVADLVLPANDGCFRLAAAAGASRCERTEEPPELACSVADLAAVYLGDTSFTALARAGRVVEHRARAVERADAMFASQTAPWTVTDW
jgi:predicted acetyltransferase